MNGAPMRVRIRNLKPGLIFSGVDTFENVTVSMDPERRYAVAEVYPVELFVAVKILSLEDGLLDGDYLDHYSFSPEPMLMKFTADWGSMEYGFCKLRLWAPELANEFGGAFERTVRRFYFDWDRYTARYQEQCGVPCPKKYPHQR